MMNFKSINRAVCIFIIMLSASCSTGSKQNSEKKSPQELAQLYVELGTAALLQGEYPQAIEDLRKALKLNEKNIIAHNHLGLAYYYLGKRDLAHQEIIKATEIDPKYSDAWINLGNFALDQKKNTQAREYYNKALDNLEYKLRHRALTALAQLSLKEGKTEEARELLYQSLQVNPEYCLSHFLLGTILKREQNYKRAAEEFAQSIVKTCTGEADRHYQLGLTYLELREFSKAKNEFLFLVEKFPQTIEAQKAGDKLKDIP